MNAYKHQQDIIDDDPKRTGLFLGTGAGKSFIGLSLAQENTLVICPKTIKEDGTWERQLSKMDKKLYLTTISKETFRRDAHKLPAFDTVIVDEAHTCLGVTPSIRWRNKKPVPKASQLYESLDSYLERTKPERLYLCTATIIRSPMTVWAAGKLLGKDWDFYKWRQTFYFRLNMPGREVWSPKTDEATKERLGEAVRKLGYTGQLSDYFDVPEQTYKVIYTELTSAQKQRIKLLPLDYPDPLVLVGKRHQLENGLLNGDEFNQIEEFPNEKLKVIEDLAIEFPKLVIFAKYIEQIRQIGELMARIGKKVLILDGSTKNRGELILEANQAKECVFIAQSQVSAGWELPTYPVMVFASISYSVVDRIQGEGRILRANALKKNLYITLVTRGGIDEEVYKAILDKKDFHERQYVDNSLAQQDNLR